MLESLLPLIGGGIFGAVVKLISLKMEMRNEEHIATMQALSQKADIIKSNNDYAMKSNGFAWTRRTIALTITAIIVGAFLLPFFDKDIIINVKETVETGGSFLFGLIDNTETVHEWKQLQGAVILPEVGLSFQAIIGAYFGASIANRR